MLRTVSSWYDKHSRNRRVWRKVGTCCPSHSPCAYAHSLAYLNNYFSPCFSVLFYLFVCVYFLSSYFCSLFCSSLFPGANMWRLYARLMQWHREQMVIHKAARGEHTCVLLHSRESKDNGLPAARWGIEETSLVRWYWD